MAKFEVYFFGLICFNTDDGVAEIVQDTEHCPFIYAPKLGTEKEITGDLELSLPKGHPAPPGAVTSLKAHVSKTGGTAELNLRRKVFKLWLPDGDDFRVAEYFHKRGQFNGKGPEREVPRITVLISNTDTTDDISLKMAGTEIAKIPADSWLLVANISKKHDCKKDGSHFAKFRQITTANTIDELCDGSKGLTSSPNPPNNFTAVWVEADKPKLPCKGGMVVTDLTQVDCSSSQWP